MARSRRRILRLSLPLLVAFSLAGCSGGGDSPTETGALTPADVEFESFALLNEARAGAGAGPLELDEAVSRVGREHSRAMRDLGFFGHTDPNGNRLRQRLELAGIDFSSAAENLIQVSHRSNPALAAHSQLMASADHRVNILNDSFRLAGVGVASAGDAFWITQIFIKP